MIDLKRVVPYSAKDEAYQPVSAWLNKLNPTEMEIWVRANSLIRPLEDDVWYDYCDARIEGAR